MAEPEQRTLRLYLILATALVLIGGSAGFLVWWTTHPSQAGEQGADEDLSTVVLRPVDFLPQTSPEERRRITSLLNQAVYESPDLHRPSSADDEIVSLGELAAARLVDAFHRLSLGEGYRAEANRLKGGAADRLLVRIRRNLPKAPYPLLRGRGDDHVGSMERRARGWQRWWDVIQSGRASGG